VAMGLHAAKLPPSPQPGAPYTYITTSAFLSLYGFNSLRDLPEMEKLEEAGLLSKDALLPEAHDAIGDMLGVVIHCAVQTIHFRANRRRECPLRIRCHDIPWVGSAEGRFHYRKVHLTAAWHPGAIAGVWNDPLHWTKLSPGPWPAEVFRCGGYTSRFWPVSRTGGCGRAMVCGESGRRVMKANAVSQRQRANSRHRRPA
jgi:hypothetical protein